MANKIEYGSLEYFELAGKTIWGNAWGTKWKAWTKLRYKKYMELTKEIWKTGGKNILDIGCCDGDFLNALYNKARLNNYYGADCSGAAISNIKNRNIKGYRCLVSELPEIFTNRMDLIFCCGTIHYCEPFDVAFDNIIRCLNYNGIFLLEYPYFDNERRMMKELKKRFIVKHIDYEYGKWYQDFFEKEWRESQSLEHNDILIWIRTLILLSSKLLAYLFEYITIKFGGGKLGKSGKILICEVKHED